MYVSHQLWNSSSESETAQALALLWRRDLLLLPAVRDLSTSEVEKLIIDNSPEYERLLQVHQAFMPSTSADRNTTKRTSRSSTPTASRWSSTAPQIGLGLPQVRQSLVIDQGEALTAIDVNTGQSPVDVRNLGRDHRKTNLGRAKKSPTSCLRNIGGIIIIDFIDAGPRANREKVMRLRRRGQTRPGRDQRHQDLRQLAWSR